jgi:hypothetical protein
MLSRDIKRIMKYIYLIQCDIKLLEESNSVEISENHRNCLIMRIGEKKVIYYII